MFQNLAEQLNGKRVNLGELRKHVGVLVSIRVMIMRGTDPMLMLMLCLCLRRRLNRRYGMLCVMERAYAMLYRCAISAIVETTIIVIVIAIIVIVIADRNSNSNSTIVIVKASQEALEKGC